MSLFPSRRRSGLSILESLIVMAVCILLLLITVPVALVRAGIWKPAKPVEVERPKDLVPKGLHSGDPDARVPVPEAPRLPPDAKVPERLKSDKLMYEDPLMKRTPPTIPSELPSAPESKEPTKPASPTAAGPQAPAAPPSAISPTLPGETPKP